MAGGTMVSARPCQSMHRVPDVFRPEAPAAGSQGHVVQAAGIAEGPPITGRYGFV